MIFLARTVSGPHPEQGADDQERHRAPLRGERRISPRAPHLHRRGLSLVANTLQHLAHDDRRQPKTLHVELYVEPVRLGIVQAIEVVNPHGAVDDHHGQVTSGGVRAVTNEGRLARPPSLSNDEGWPGRGSESATAAPPQPQRASSLRRCSASPAASTGHRCRRSYAYGLCKDRTILCIGSLAHGEAIWPSSRRPSRCKYSWRFVRSNLLLSSKLVAERMPS